MLFWQSLWKNKYFLFISFIILIAISQVWNAQPLIAAYPHKGFTDYTELLVPFVFIIPISFLLHNNYEIELGLVCGVKTSRLMISKYISLFFYTLLSTILIIVLYKYSEFVPVNNINIPIPIYVPENYKLYMICSAIVTVSFFSALFLFLRVITNNCYAPVGVGLFIYTFFNQLNSNIHQGHDDIKKSILDPFISNYILGDKVPLEYYKIGPIWTYNRLLFLGLAVLMFVGSYLLLRREKLHHGSND